jgi:hypothetical protein
MIKKKTSFMGSDNLTKKKFKHKIIYLRNIKSEFCDVAYMMLALSEI